MNSPINQDNGTIATTIIFFNNQFFNKQIGINEKQTLSHAS